MFSVLKAEVVHYKDISLSGLICVERPDVFLCSVSFTLITHISCLFFISHSKSHLNLDKYSYPYLYNLMSYNAHSPCI